MEKTLVFDGTTSGTSTGCSPLEAMALGSNGNMGGMNGMFPAMMMMGGMNGGFGGMNNPFWAIVLLAFLRQWGFGTNGINGTQGIATQNQLDSIQETLNTNQGQTLLMNAINGVSGSVKELANALNSDVNTIQTAINGVQAAISNVSNQVGMTGQQVINAINAGDSNLQNAIQTNCCAIKQEITNFGYQNQINNLQQSQMIQNGFSQIGYANAENTCAIKQNATDNTNRVIDKLDAIEDARKDREIASLTAALTAANSRAERQAELNPIYQALSDIKCKQQDTITVPYSPVTTVPNSVVYGAMLGNLGYGYGYQSGQIWS